jgi:hypothetical protein
VITLGLLNRHPKIPVDRPLITSKNLPLGGNQIIRAVPRYSATAIAGLSHSLGVMAHVSDP